MARVKLGGLAQDVRGSLNGSVFSRNRGGAYVRTKVSPVQPVSAFSSAARAFFKAVSQLWAGTSLDGKRVAWDAFAAVHAFVNVFGDSIILSGIAMFQAVNRRLLGIGADALLDPPADFEAPDLGTITVDMTASGGVLSDATITAGIPPVYPCGLYLFCTGPRIDTRKFQRNDYRLVNNPETGLFDSAEDLKAALDARFPDAAWNPGCRVGFLVAALDPTEGSISSAVAADFTLA